MSVYPHTTCPLNPAALGGWRGQIAHVKGLLNITGNDTETLTMSSLEMVSYINSTRKAGEAELRHDHFMVKVQKVLGILAPKFLGTSFYVNGAGNNVNRPIYNFPKREAMLMAMSYSYETQAQVFDAWEGVK